MSMRNVQAPTAIDPLPADRGDSSRFPPVVELRGEMLDRIAGGNDAGWGIDPNGGPKG